MQTRIPTWPHVKRSGTRSGYPVMMRVIACAIVLVCAVTVTSTGYAETQQVTYLENSDHELTIYHITGAEPGNTMMIIGGIQGDEPGGYLSADLYADILLEKGNLIVVPRANVNSIRMNLRGVNGDMNRRFSPDLSISGDSEQHIVEILKSLIQQSDVVLNLHDGSGFYYPTYESDMRNPLRFGQSIIADAETYTRSDSVVVDLIGPAERVIDSVNQNIRNELHHFRFNNHNTINDDTRHPEQRRSATYYSLTEVGIPAFGIETSKSISPVSTKVKYQTLVINAFMAEYGIIPEHPSVSLPEPELDYLVVQLIGNPHHFAVKNGETLTVPVGSSVHVTDIVANYQRGLSIDIQHFGDANDLGQVAVVREPTNIIVYKDAFQCGIITIDTAPEAIQLPGTSTSPGIGTLEQVTFTVGGKNVVVSRGDTLHIVRGDLVTITRAETTTRQTGFRVNFVGFVGNQVYNDAEDRGYQVNTSHDLLEDYSLDGRGALYEIKAEELSQKRPIGSVFLHLQPPRVNYLVVECQDGSSYALKPGDTFTCSPKARITAQMVVANISAQPEVEVYFRPQESGMTRLRFPHTLEIESDGEIVFRRGATALGSITFRTDE